MAEYVVPPAVKIVADQAKEYASPCFGYFFSYKKIVEDFTNQREELELRKQRVDTRVDEAKRQIEVIYEDVEDWLKRAEKELKETQNLKDEIDRVKCFKWCPKWGWRYSLSKKLAEKTPIISKLLETSNFAQVGYRRPLQGIEFITSTDFMDSESSKSALNQIMEAIKVVNMIGLHGMPGVGKTTLAKEVGKHAREQKLFDKVVMFTMSQNPNIKNIQHKVADIFGLKFETSSQEGKAEELCWKRDGPKLFRSMQRVNKILVIVDDLWEEFKLESIGIPCGDDHKGCKILLTTRHQQVCTKMNCQKEIQLGILSEDEAWVLFRDQAGLEDDCSILNEVAKEVAGECKGLPLAIVAVAKALKGESLDEWRDANQRFKDSTHLYDEEVFGGVLEPLKLSYDYLKKGNNQMTGNDIQMCFLLFSLFPEDFEVFIEELIMYGIGVGLFPNVYSIEDKRKKIIGALKKLQKSGLLLESDDGETIRMHDVVLDFARWITSTGENRFMVKNKLKEWPDMDESLGCYTAIALFYCSSNIQNFPEKVNTSKLKTLILHGEEEGDDLAVVSSTFLEEMKALQVLYLHNISFSPKGFHSLPNLKTLFCLNCKWEHLSSSLTNMSSLEILALFGTKIDEISEGLVKLSTLKYLRLSSRRIEEEAVKEEEEEMNFPPKLVSRLTSLQEPNKNNINLLELNSLSRLTTLSVELSTIQFSQKGFVFPKLQRYVIFVNSYMSILKVPNIRKLRIENFSSSLSAFNDLFCNVEKLKLRMVSGLKNIVPSIGKKVLNELTSLKLDSCNDMEFLIDITRDQGSTVAFSNLVKLNIDSMVSLKGLCYGLSPSHRAIASFTTLKNNCRLCCYPKLRILEIDSCKSLKYVCTNTSTQGLQSLESVKIRDCPQLMQIFNMEQNENGQDVVLPQDLFLSNVGTIWKTDMLVLNEDCIVVGNHENVFQVQGGYSFSRIKELDLRNLFEMRIIWNNFAEVVTLKNLTTLILIDCKKLRYIFSPTMARSLSHLEYLFIKGCEEIERLILAKDQISSSSSSNAGLQPISFPNLTNITITNCGNLKSLFPFVSVHVLPKLERLKVKRNSKLEQVFELEDELEVVAEEEMKFDKLEKLSFKELPSLIHFSPKGYHFVLSALEDLKAKDCPKLTTSFSIDSQEFVHCKTKV
ncbi:hypothetical protein E1A91_A04G021300v1 [Gossypium mustelinum]|uniref:Uncharacterized protein n=1 Tax=Gossypium mustelinum TaxID=34275 RepID=A0A5D2ZL62_GOSMU|nr:hypothetical protein E1A91_A04G021300v1 [Gossypium mustelinum]